MYACIPEIDGGFFAGCVQPNTQPLIPTTRPLTVRELLPASAGRSKGNEADSTFSTPCARSGR